MTQQIDLSEPLLTLGEVAPFLKQAIGFPIGPSTIEKLFSPAINDGPKPAGYVGKRPLYRRADVVAWAKARISDKPQTSAHNWPDKERERFKQLRAKKPRSRARA